MTGAEASATTDVDELRRRLYRPDATPADVDRYLAEQHAVAPPVPPAAPPAPPRSRVRSALGATLVAAAAVAAVLALLPHPSAAPRPIPTPDPRTTQLDIGDGRLLAVDPDAASGPTPTSVTVDGAPTAGQRFTGVGDAVLRIQLPEADFGTQRAAVIVTAGRGGVVSWRALRLETRRDWSSYEQVVAQDRVVTGDDLESDGAFSYAGAPPTRLAVLAPAGRRWTLVVASDTGATDGLH